MCGKLTIYQRVSAPRKREKKCGLGAHTINHNEFDWKEIIVCYGEYIVRNANHSTAIIGYEIDTIDQTKSKLQQP